MGPDPRDTLSRFEKLALSVGRLANERKTSKDIQYRFLRTATYSWCYPSMSRRTLVDNIDWLIAPPSDRGVIFACNHRSFFDAYLFMFALYRRKAAWPRHIYFPVRSNFFYEGPLGMLVNFAIGGGSMYPPIFRDSKKSALNQDALARIANFLDQPNTLVGIHPEGTRNKGPDPYQLLPAQPGIGQIVLQNKPLVVPLFINGLVNDFVGAMRDSFEPNAKRDKPIIIAFGDPVDYSDLTEQKPRAALYKKCADRIMAGIAACGEREKTLRAKCASGEIAADHPDWLWHASS